jgi:hypothetical protein
MNKYFGYFDSPEQTKPAFDPGIEIDCIICREKLSSPTKTISLMREDRGDNRSYFYRVHAGCYLLLDEELITEIESVVIDNGLLNYKLMRCEKCGKVWFAGYPNEAEKLQCPECNFMNAVLPPGIT